MKAKVRRFLKDFEQHENEYKPGTEIRESHHLKSILGGEAKGQMGLYATKTFKAGIAFFIYNRSKTFTFQHNNMLFSKHFHGKRKRNIGIQNYLILI